jgi:hypothetical protein
MVDKLELRLPRVTLFKPQVREFMLESRHFENSARTMGSGRYSWVSDLRPVGVDALLHFSLKRDAKDPHEGEHKLELLDTGAKVFSEIAAQIEETIEGSVADLEIMRIDLCADIAGTPLEWFFQRLRVKFKRFAHEIGTLKAQRIGKAGIQTLACGKRPNMFRAYDKVAEYKHQLRYMQRKRSRESDELTLESEFGVTESSVITRLEQQYGGGRVPIEIDCMSRLPRLPDFNPFRRIEIVNGTSSKQPSISDVGLAHWVMGTRLSELRDEMGNQQFNRWLSVHSCGNSARWKREYADFLSPHWDNRLTIEDVYATYRESVTRQLAA